MDMELYMLVLTCAERDLIKKFLKLPAHAIGEVAEACQKEVILLLIRRPYPTLQILNNHLGTSKFLIGQTLTKALQLLVGENEHEFSLQFINFLANLHLDNVSNVTLRNNLIERLIKPPLNDLAYIALLSQTDFELLKEVSAGLTRQWQRYDRDVCREFVLTQALNNKLHFAPLVSLQLKEFHNISDAALRNNLIILKVANELSDTSQTLVDLGNIAKWIEAFTIFDSSQNLQEVHQFFFADFQRINSILEFLKKYPVISRKIKIGTLLNVSGILELLSEYEIEASYDETRSIIEHHIKISQQQMPSNKRLHELELETLAYYSALSIVYDVILTDVHSNCDQYYIDQMQQLNTMLRQMHGNMDALCSLIEDIFQLVFLRWEHLRSDSTVLQTNRNKQAHENGDSLKSTDDNDAVDSSPLLLTPSPYSIRYGFICRGPALYHLFTFLKKFVTKKCHSDAYKNSSERIQKRFQNIVDIIGEALWKYSILEKLEDSNARNGDHQEYILEAEELLQLVQKHIDPFEKLSSDDESRDRTNYTSLTRRKAAKKRRRTTFSGEVVTSAGAKLTLEQCRARANAMVASVSAVHGVQNPVVQLKARNMVSHFSNRSIIPKMLGSPENLAIMALALKNFNDVKYIIETFKLQNSELNNELFFIEQQQQIKQKLATIYANYQRQEEQSRINGAEPRATVEHIRNVAAKGFEVSKIISVVDNFAQLHKIQQTPELNQLLAKHSNNPQHAYLRQFEECNLNAVIICDLVLNLPFNREILTNILMVIKRQQHIATDTTTRRKEKSNIPTKEIGPMPFLANLCECMRLLDQNKTQRDLLLNNLYSLKPSKLTAELQRESAFQAVFYKASNEFGRAEDLKAFALLFQNFQSQNNYYGRFCAYMTHLTRLLQLRYPNVEYHVSELLKIDSCDIIGELIFDCKMTPLEIEANVTALNLNLVHVIALNICPEIAGKRLRDTRIISSKKLATILNYISNQNYLLAYLLQGVSNSANIVSSVTMSPQFIERFLKLTEVERLAAMYGGNKFIAVLRSDDSCVDAVEEMESKLEQLEILQLQMGNRDAKQKQKQGKAIDDIIVKLISEDARNIHLSLHISDIGLKAKLIQENFTKIATTKLAKELIENTLQHKDAISRIPVELRKQLEDILADITVYAKVSEVLNFETWPQAYDFGLKTPSAIFEKLLQLHLYKLCYEWCQVVKLTERFPQHMSMFLNSLLKCLLELNDDGSDVNVYLLRILETFPVKECVKFLDKQKDCFRSLGLLQYVIGFLEKNSQNVDSDMKYRNYKISLNIFEQLAHHELEQFWNLMKFPLLILEQLIMNAKLEILGKVLTAVRKLLLQEHAKNPDVAHVCAFCFDKRGNIYDIHSKNANNANKAQFQLGIDSGNSTHSAFILLNFNLYQIDHIITDECIDLLLRIYATKALDYHISENNSVSEPNSQNTDMQQSLDSLCGAFQMPKSAPARDEWVNDDDATHCMCCRRAAFTMLVRRHHCRRCGRVVCFACSTHRMVLPELYAEVEVRICSDCHQSTEEAASKNELTKEQLTSMERERESSTSPMTQMRSRKTKMFKWQLSGNITHDKLLREEFCYEHAPSVALCLSILNYHLGQQKCVELLLFHCRNLEQLIVPNPEVDYELVAKMMNCLALAAKVRGGPPEVETIREHSDIIISVVQNNCESLIPPGPLNNHSLRKLADSLVQAEKWQLALDVHLKWGFPTAGVMAAHGLACLRAGCLDTAREKFSHCMSKLSNELINSRISKFIMNAQSSGQSDSSGSVSDFIKELKIPQIKRPQRGPPLLQEILQIIESAPTVRPQPETLHRASIIRNSNSSLSSLISRRKEPYSVPTHEPALNVLSTLANLKRISKGQYSEGRTNQTEYLSKSPLLSYHNECLHYVLTYGSHTDVLQYLMRRNELNASLKYFALQNLDADLFIHNIFLVMLRCGEVPTLVTRLYEFDAQLLMWRNAILHTCRYLETHNLLNSLYQLQTLLRDSVRACMTCVKFYSIDCDSFQQLHANAQHLHNAHRHLQSELEVAQWDNIQLDTMQKRKSSISNRRSSATSNTGANVESFVMRMDARTLNGHINTILKQLDVSKFLATCEKEKNPIEDLVTVKILKQIRMDTEKTTLPTLFETAQEKIEICIMILLCGKNIEEGFGLAYRIIQDYKLPSVKIFASTAKYLARNKRLFDVEKLLNCVTSNNGTDTRDIDEILSIAIHSATNSHEPDVKMALDILVKKIHSVELRISSHIFIGQLKSAYLLANKYERIADIRKVMRQAELTGQIHIKKLCEKKLNMSGPSHTQ